MGKVPLLVMVELRYQSLAEHAGIHAILRDWQPPGTITLTETVERHVPHLLTVTTERERGEGAKAH